MFNSINQWTKLLYVINTNRSVISKSFNHQWKITNNSKSTTSKLLCSNLPWIQIGHRFDSKQAGGGSDPCTNKGTDSSSQLPSFCDSECGDAKDSQQKPDPFKPFGEYGYNKKWLHDRYLIASLLFTLPIFLMYPTKIGDFILIGTVMLHQHWGIQGVVRDYVREEFYGNAAPRWALTVVQVISCVATVGLMHFVIRHCCIGESIRQFWAIKGDGK